MFGVVDFINLKIRCFHLKGVSSKFRNLTRMSLYKQNLKYQDSLGTNLEGYVAWDSDKLGENGQLPGVLVAHTAVGPQEDFIYDKVHRLADLGYVGFSLDMFGAGQLLQSSEDKQKYNQQLKDNRELIADRASAALKTLQGLEQVNPEKIAAIGYCLGGKVVIDLARTNPQGLKGVVSYHGILDKYVPNEPTYFGARVLAFHGTKDPYIQPEMLTGFIQEMEERKVDCDLVQFVNCVHSFTRPDKQSEQDLQIGQQYSETADKRSWEQTALFLQKIFE
eukprot:TRINITY_DN8912_c1_g1_i2.p1 TRINITY_DN8912_c1_g1~~TRINITY_DN8912_c1_g1_i2.p1  ORF type:complete len:278 (-),score=43.62 TRINITY_DN8912_c1_g1_i2:216-1049(-)